MAISQKIHSISKNDLWETPKIEFEYYSALLGVFPKLDVCATSNNSKCTNFITKEKDSLLQEWNEDFFMNPPYSEVTNWMHKAFYQSKKYNVNGLILVNANTSTKWWKKYVTETNAEICTVDHRIKFEKDGIAPKEGSMLDSAFVVYRKKSHLCNIRGGDNVC